jgi:nicotinate-nucleotide adenylyltransferase
MRRAILGGTFDPPHIAHLLAGEAAYRQLGVDVVTFMPAGAPWQKADREVSDPVHRWRMTRLTVEGIPYFEADPREVERDGWTYTIETLESFPPEEELWLVLGADAAAGLPTWHRYREVVERARIAVAPRPGTDRRQIVQGDAVWLDMPELPISGTELRHRAREGRSIRFLVRDRVWDYICTHGLYRAETGNMGPRP